MTSAKTVATARMTAVASHMFVDAVTKSGNQTFNSTGETWSEVMDRATRDMVAYAEAAGVTVTEAYAEVKAMVDAA